MTSTTTLAIVGAGLAGAKAAEGARNAGFTDRIIVIGDERHPPYERPPLSKGVLQGRDEPSTTAVHDVGYYEAHGIELVNARARSIDPNTRFVETDTGERIPYDRAVIATGSTPRRLTVPGAALPGVHYLRTIDDSLHLRDSIRGATSVAIIGAGWIGTEVAASARTMGAAVALIDPAEVPLQRVLGDEIGGMFRDLHQDNGVAMHLGVGVSDLRGSDRVEEVVLSNGRTLAADVVIVGIGVEPCTAPVESTQGIVVDDGIVTDEHLRTGVPHIWAAGDVANAWHPRYRRHVRVEHWANALNQGLTAGRNAAGGHEAYERLPYFYSDQYDVGLEYVGHADGGDSMVIRGSLARREFIALWHRDGTPTAAMNVNVWDVVDDLKAVVSTGAAIDVDRFRDPNASLSSVADAR